MESLIKALQIFSKYTSSLYPTWCRHDELHVNVSKDDVTDEDLAELHRLSFYPDPEMDDFVSFKYGSC